MPRIQSVRFHPFDVPLLEPFGIAGGAQLTAQNVLIELELEDGSRGLGEAAPFPAVNGETQADVLEALTQHQNALLDREVGHYRALSEEWSGLFHETPSARAALEIALFDALARRARLPLWAFWGGAQTELHTDITIPTGTVEHASSSARRARERGFRSLKIKIGGGDLDQDVRRVRAVFAATPELELLLDANASLSAEQALWFLRELGEARNAVALFEQPTPARDLEGLARVERDGKIPVAADESARSRADVSELIQKKICSVINVKTAKTGVVEAWDILTQARTMGLDLMIGGMVETELSMTTSACLAAGLGGVRYVDLDTPLFLGERPLSGGFAQEGPRLDLTPIKEGHGVRLLETPAR